MHTKVSAFIPIPPKERHTLRVFALDMTAAEVAALRDADAVLEPGQVLPYLRTDAAARLLGVAVDATQVEVFHTDDVEAIGLAAYLIEGNAVSQAQIAADADRLDAYRGYVMTIRSQAFGGQAATLRPDPKARLMGTYSEEVPPVRFDPLPTSSASGVLGGGRAPMSDARIGGMVATFVLLFLFVLTGLLIWIAR
jgi:hypothetical protein